MKVPSSHKALLSILQDKEARGQPITKEEILEETQWKEVTFKTYLNKGQLSDFLSKTKDNYFDVSNSLKLTAPEFTKMLSQSKHRRGLGHNCNSKLAKALLRKSRDNMMLALELYNRPSLENRMDGFVLCFCIAWEQLLKAILIEKDGENSIFKEGKNKRKVRETISLRECLKRIYKPSAIARMNVEKIAFFRDEAVHLLMPEVQGIMSRVFQSGVMNYSTEFYDFTEQSFIASNHSGMLSLVGDLAEPSVAVLQGNYGEKVGGEILNLVLDLTEEAQSINNIQFAIPLDVKLVFSRKDDEGNTITLAKAEDGIEGLKKAIVLEKPARREKTHPYRETDAITEINKRLKDRYTQQDLTRSLIASDKETKVPKINSHCFRAVVSKLNWKNSQNRFHYKNVDPTYHYYSDFAVDEFIQKVMNIDGYLKKAREDYSKRHANKRSANGRRNSK